MDSPSLPVVPAKRGLAKAPLPEPFLVSLYRAPAPYRGCAHGCAYCDGRAEKYYVEGDFERDICLRPNVPELIADDAARGLSRGEFGAVCIGSGVTDVYQPIEAELRLTRRTLEVLAPLGLPLVILTKSTLALRDFDLLARFPAALLILTVTTMDPDLARLIEPGAPPPAERLELVRKAKEAGFFAGIMAMPLCPGVSDSKEQTEALFAAAAGAGADFVCPGGLTLRPGRQKELFLERFLGRYPSLGPLYMDIYGEERPSGMPRASYIAPRGAEWNRALIDRGMPQMIPHRVYRHFLSPPDSIFVLLCHLKSLYAMRGVDTRPLVRATEKYAAWLRERRTSLRRKAPRKKSAGRGSGTLGFEDDSPGMADARLGGTDRFPITEALTAELLDRCATNGGFAELCGNRKLGDLVSSLILEGGHFDYPTLAIKR